MTDFFTKLIELFNTPEYMDSLLRGFLLTIEISFFAILVGFALGTIIALIETAKPSKWLIIPKWLCHIYTTIIRGTPMALQLFIMFFIIFAIRDFPELITAVLAFGFNSAAYTSEIIRGGILSVDKGQKEAGLALGLKNSTIFRKIIAPQAIKNIIPALGNEIVTVIKETAIVSMVGMYDLNMAAKDIGSGHNLASYIVPMFTAALFYLATIYLITFLVRRLEKRLRKSDNQEYAI
ncbi:amino acid ABC transporter permease [Candidatus Saccharibacteria bacterium]|nr:amino acid ABC transporter permease [Candidatus Saccharibacteria bacterium]MBQ3296280.1 amino acid ABC transporter permease [Candidatus Saccharibacteria bacterium]